MTIIFISIWSSGGATAFSIFPELGRRSGYDGYGVFSGPRPQVPLPPTSMISQMPMRPTFNGTGFHGASKGDFFCHEMKIVVNLHPSLLD